MPRGDQKGPEGQGPMTGRKLGLCVGNKNPGFVTNSFGNGFRNGMGSGGGRGTGFYGRRIRGKYLNNPNKNDELNMLINQAKSLQSNLDEINKRISDLS